MENIKFYCKCGYTTEHLGTLDDLTEIVICPLCNTPMNLEDDFREIGNKNVARKTDDLLLKTIITDATEKMRIQIKEYGCDFCFKVIEDFKNVKTRIAYRDLFFKAGGVIPESEI